jgi:hypothetical protein
MDNRKVIQLIKNGERETYWQSILFIARDRSSSVEEARADA